MNLSYTVIYRTYGSANHIRPIYSGYQSPLTFTTPASFVKYVTCLI